jgi:tyrosinase
MTTYRAPSGQILPGQSDNSTVKDQCSGGTSAYWNWTDPDSTRAVFTDSFMGGDGDPADDFAVTSGPFRKDQWKLAVNPPGILASPSATTYLTRHFGSFLPALPTSAELEAALVGPQYDTAPYDSTSDSSLSFRNTWEGFRSPAGTGPTGYVCGPDGIVTPNLNADGGHNHNAVHAWVGGIRGVTPAGVPLFGTMVLPSSPNDPTFFLLHANVDRVWARWQSLHGTDSYQPTEGYAENNADDIMHPFDEGRHHRHPRDGRQRPPARVPVHRHRYVGDAGRSTACHRPTIVDADDQVGMPPTPSGLTTQTLDVEWAGPLADVGRTLVR